MEVSIADMVLLLAALAIVFVIYKLNGAIRLLNNRVNILSHGLKQLRRDLEATAKVEMDTAFMAEEADLRAQLDRDFR